MQLTRDLSIVSNALFSCCIPRNTVAHCRRAASYAIYCVSRDTDISKKQFTCYSCRFIYLHLLLFISPTQFTSPGATALSRLVGRSELDINRPHGEGLKKLLQTHTHIHPFNGPVSGTTRVSRYQKGKTNLDFTEARDNEWQWHQLGQMQVCTLLQTDNHASTPQLLQTRTAYFVHETL